MSGYPSSANYLPMNAGEDITSMGLVVRQSATEDNTVLVCDDTSIPFGVSIIAAEEDHTVFVAIEGPVRVLSSGAITRGSLLSADEDGRVKALVTSSEVYGASDAGLLFTLNRPSPVALTDLVDVVEDGSETPLSVDVVAGQVIINLETDGGGSAISTATEVLNAVNAHPVASTIVVVTLADESDGSGVVAEGTVSFDPSPLTARCIALSTSAAAGENVLVDAIIYRA